MGFFGAEGWITQPNDPWTVQAVNAGGRTVGDQSGKRWWQEHSGQASPTNPSELAFVTTDGFIGDVKALPVGGAAPLSEDTSLENLTLTTETKTVTKTAGVMPTNTKVAMVAIAILVVWMLTRLK